MAVINEIKSPAVKPLARERVVAKYKMHDKATETRNWLTPEFNDEVAD